MPPPSLMPPGPLGQREELATAVARAVAQFSESPAPSADTTEAIAGRRRAAVPPRRYQARAALALAEAILPGSAAIPGADEDTVRRAEAVLAEFSPAVAKAWRLAQSALSTAAVLRTGRPFHRLSADRQEKLLKRWERDPVLRVALTLIATVYKLVHFDRDDVFEALGGVPKPLPIPEVHRWQDQIVAADSWTAGDTVECDVVVVGTGAGGAVVGRELADRGHAVVFVEEGQYFTREAFGGSAVKAHKTFYRAAVSVGNAPIPIFVGRLVGGSTAINTGTCFRTPAWVLDRWSEELGNDEFGPERMLPYFQRVEEVIQVAPTERRAAGPMCDVISRGADKLGWTHFALNRNAPGCDGSGFCDFGCQTEARRGTHLAYVPPALEKGAMVITGLQAERVLLENGRAVGLAATSRSGRRFTVRAKAVILAGGAIPTPLFLMKQGLGNRSGQLGRNLSVHPSGAFMSLQPDRIDPAGHMPQGYGCDQFFREGLMLLAAQPEHRTAGLVMPFVGRDITRILERFEHVANLGILMADHRANGRVWRDVNGFPLITYNLQPEDMAKMQKGLVHAGELLLAAGARSLVPIVLGAGVLDGPRGLDKLRRMNLKPSDVLWTSYHPLGTCRIGSDPKTSVVDLDHQLHGTEGLFVVDGSTVRGPLGVNPQITIMAMATRAAERIHARLN